MLVKSQKIVVAFSAWALLALALLTLFNSLNYEYAFIIDLLGLLVITLLLSPYTMRPKWRSRLDAALLTGTAIFIVLIGCKALDFLGFKIGALRL